MKFSRFFQLKPSLVFPVLVFSLSVLAALSCSTEGSLQQILGTKAEAPVFLDYRSVSSSEMAFGFSQSVRVVSLHFSPVLEVGSVGEGSEVTVAFAAPLAEGMKVTADILVEDSSGNTLNVIVPFRARNDRMPPLVFNELRTEYSKPKVEFVEFIAKGAGNLGALRLFIASHSLSTPAYEFPPAEVKAGEYIVLHLRTLEEECLDETGTDLTLSGGTEAQDGSRDFWLPGAVKMLRKTDALWIMDQDDRIIDAVLLGETPESVLGNAKTSEAAEFLCGKKAWLPDPAGAVITAGTTNTRTICRDEGIPASPQAKNWYIAATSSATPGKPNSTKRYNP